MPDGPGRKWLVAHCSSMQIVGKVEVFPTKEGRQKREKTALLRISATKVQSSVLEQLLWCHFHMYIHMCILEPEGVLLLLAHCSLRAIPQY